MRHFLLIGIVLLISCKTNNQDTKEVTAKDTIGVNTSTESKATSDHTYFWTGSINSNIPIFLWLTIKDSLLQGEVMYTNTKRPTPIKLLGNISKDGDIRVCEFQKDGKITGVFVFNKIDNMTTGTWASTKRDTEFTFQLSSKDTTLLNVDTSFQSHKLSGDYSYSYGEDGSAGGITVTEIDSDRVAFDISATTSAPSYNVANIEKDTVSVLNNEFVYKVPDSDSCIFRVKFLKDFIFIDYVKDYGDCGNIFGLNASVDGIFYRIK